MRPDRDVGPGIARRIIGFHQDEEAHWVADLECGHSQHVRHVPPWQNRPWVLTAEGRAGFLGRRLRCVECPQEAGPDEPRFFADAMLARLARWLRVLGFDTRFDPGVDDRALVAVTGAEKRVLLTRDRHLVDHLRPARAVLVRANEPLVQLREVIAACDLDLARPLFTRCLVCNAALRGATMDEVEELVPDRAQELRERVLRCDGCGRVYWPGSHARRMHAALTQAFPEASW
jgi:uncharacterized protein